MAKVNWNGIMGFFNIIAIEDTFLRVFDKPQNVRLSKQVIEFNYSHLSPFKNGDILYYQTRDKIYVWYLQNQLRVKNAITIPEGFLLYRFFRERRDAVVVLPRNEALNALVISQGELRAQVTLKGVVDQEAALDLLKREYSLQEMTLIRLEAAARFAVKPADLLAFAHFEFKSTGLIEKLIGLAKGPVIAMLLITAGFTLYNATRLEGIYSEKKSYLEKLKRENAPLQTSLDKVREQNSYWSEFVAKEQAYPDFYQVLTQLGEVLKRHGGYLNSVDYADNRISIWTGLKTSEAAIIKDLLETGLFMEVKLLASTKDFSKPEYNLYNMSIAVRPLSKGGRS
jgi:hypothetical protein